jgi:hypothetical protein
VTCCKQDTSSSSSNTYDVTGSRRTHDAIVTNNQLLYAICGTDLSNQLRDFGVPVTSITTNDQCRAFNTFGDREEDTGNERFAVVFFLENFDLFTKT